MLFCFRRDVAGIFSAEPAAYRCPPTPSVDRQSSEIRNYSGSHVCCDLAETKTAFLSVIPSLKRPSAPDDRV